ncbi:AraC family transcriptional regulator [Actinocrispum sp. NPDC049592]|uniref:AraC family transcriptional regulator n=1 Tax=Actinocrispum sp. NPDC049592 TaxID=3154835 RepID=UPI003417538E
MDTLTGLVDGPRARGAFLLRSVLNPPWSLRIEDRAPLSLVTMIHGDAWIVPDVGSVAQLRPGEVAILRGPDPYSIADDPKTKPNVVIGEGQVCTVLSGPGIAAPRNLGIRTWGDGGSTVMLSGTYTMTSEIGQRLLSALPPVLVRGAGPDNALITLLANEISKDDTGQELVLDRILDLLLVTILRSWLGSPGAPAWYKAQQDPVVGAALKLLHEDPAQQWTVASLATTTGVSRTALARRFTTLVGEPPMSYLTGLRIALAADLLREPGATLGAVARKVGYGSAFALSAAFKRVRGVSPQEHRTSASQRPTPIVPVMG